MIRNQTGIKSRILYWKRCKNANVFQNTLKLGEVNLPIIYGIRKALTTFDAIYDNKDTRISLFQCGKPSPRPGEYGKTFLPLLLGDSEAQSEVHDGDYGDKDYHNHAFFVFSSSVVCAYS